MSLRRLIEALVDADVDFIIVGMVAGNLHGSQYVTEDLDVVYEASTKNLERLIAALAPFKPRIGGFWPLEGSDESFTLERIVTDKSLTVITSEGELDLLARIDGIGEYDHVARTSENLDLEGRNVRIISLSGLIATKRASGREKDRLHLPELELIKELNELKSDDRSEQP